MATSVGQLKLVADTKDLKRARKEMEQMKKSGKGMSEQNKKAGLSFKSMKVPILAVVGAIAAAAAAFGVFGKVVFDVSRRVEDFRSSLTAVTRETGNYTEQLALLRTVTTTLPVDVKNMEKAFIALNGNGVTPTLELITAFANAASITTDKTGAMTTAVTVWTRSLNEGAVSLQELDKLSDRGIAVFTILADKLGVTRGELLKFSKQAGNTKLILDTLQDAFLNSPLFSGAAAADMETTNGQLILMNNNWDSFIQTIGRAADASDTFLSVIKFVNKSINDLSFLVSFLNDEFDKFSTQGLRVKLADVTAALEELQEASLTTRFIIGTGQIVGGSSLDELIEEKIAEVKLLKELIKQREELKPPPPEKDDPGTSSTDKVTKSIERQIEAQKEQTRVLFEQAEAFKQNEPAREDLLRGIETEAQLRKLGKDATTGQINEMRLLIDLQNVFKDQIKAIQDAEKLAEEERKVAATAKKKREEEAAKAEEKRQEQINIIREEGKALTESLRTPQEEYIDRLNKINELLQAQAISEETAARAAEKATEDKLNSSKKFEDGITRAQKRIEKEVGDSAAKAEKLYTMAFDNISDAISEWATGGTVDIKKLATSFIKEIIRMEARAALSKIFGGLGGGAGGGGFFAGIGSAISGFFGGGGGGTAAIFTAKGAVIQSPKAFALGGQVGIAGEQGPEAILPLTRTASGDLGVKAVGMGGGSGGIIIQNLTVQVIEREDLTPQQQAQQNALAIENLLKNIVVAEMRNQSRAGNMLNPLSSGGVF